MLRLEIFYGAVTLGGSAFQKISDSYRFLGGKESAAQMNHFMEEEDQRDVRHGSLGGGHQLAQKSFFKRRIWGSVCCVSVARLHTISRHLINSNLGVAFKVFYI